MRIRVLHIITRLDAGGSAVNTLETCRRLNPEVYEVELLAGRTRDPDGLIKRFIEDHNIVYHEMPSLRRDIHPWHDVRAFCQMIAFIRRGRYDIVHTHSSKAGILGRWAAKCARVRCLVHTPHGHVFYGYFSPAVSRLFVVCERWTARITDCIITLTERGKRDHVEWEIAPPARFRTIYSGIEMESESSSENARERLPDAWRVDPDAVIIGVVARLDAVKGVSFLVEAMHLLENRHVYLLIVGDGQQRQALEDTVRAYGLNDRVHFAGFQQNPLDWMAAMDIFVLPSLNEGMGRVLLEAMHLGKPVIASDVGGIPEIVLDGQCGRLVPPGQPAAIAAKITELVNRPEERQAMGRRAKALVTEKYSLEKMVQDIEQVYREVLSGV